MVNKYVPKSTSSLTDSGPMKPGNVGEDDYKEMPTKYKNFVGSYVEKVMLASTPEVACIGKILYRQTRRPEIGDKFSSRHGQKGVTGKMFDTTFF